MLPAITTQPISATASVGASVSFSVTATGDAPLNYQWQRNGVDIAGATGAQYILPAAQFTDTGSKWNVVVRNSGGSATSSQATLTVTGTALLAGALQANSLTAAELVGIAQDGAGNVYLLDRASDTSLHKVSAQGVTTLVLLSARDSDAALYQPSGMTRDAAGNFYVTDQKCSVRKISPAGEISVLAGNAMRCGHEDGKGSSATFYPGSSALAVDAANNVYVASRAIVRKIAPDGVVTTIAGVADAYAAVDGTGAAARFGDVRSMAIDGGGNVYVTDSGGDGNGPGIRKITPGGVVTTLAGAIRYGADDGQHGSASFRTLSGLTIDAAGNLYAGDQGNHAIRKITADGVVTTFSGMLSTQDPMERSPVDGPAVTATFRQLVALSSDNSGNIFVAESSPGIQFNALRKVSAIGSVSTISGTQGGRGAADGTGPTARFSQPRGLAVDIAGKVWVADTDNQLIRQISPGGAVTTLAGATGLASLFEPGDGKGALARFFRPLAITVDRQGAAFVTDAVHNTVRKVLSDGTVTTLAGKVRSFGAADGVGSAASFVALTGITANRAGMLYVTDMGAVRRVDPASGAVTTLAGELTQSSQSSVDGTGAAARFGYLSAIAADSGGNLYVIDSFNSNVRKITPDGVVTTLAGKAGQPGFADGQGVAASFNHPEGIAVDEAGNVYVADTGNHLIRRITPGGAVTTIAGQLGANGNVPGGLNNPLSQPTGLAFDANGNLYVCAGNGIFQLHL